MGRMGVSRDPLHSSRKNSCPAVMMRKGFAQLATCKLDAWKSLMCPPRKSWIWARRKIHSRAKMLRQIGYNVRASAYNILFPVRIVSGARIRAVPAPVSIVPTGNEGSRVIEFMNVCAACPTVYPQVPELVHRSVRQFEQCCNASGSGDLVTTYSEPFSRLESRSLAYRRLHLISMRLRSGRYGKLERHAFTE